MNIDKISDSDFEIKSEQIINKIAEMIEDLDPEGKIDLDLNDGILTLGTSDGVFVINKQRVAKEIWLSSPISGPHHFFLNKGIWKSSSDKELFKIINSELGTNL